VAETVVNAGAATPIVLDETTKIAAKMAEYEMRIAGKLLGADVNDTRFLNWPEAQIDRAVLPFRRFPRKYDATRYPQGNEQSSRLIPHRLLSRAKRFVAVYNSCSEPSREWRLVAHHGLRGMPPIWSLLD
jgi:hypothetical protein